LKPTTSDAEGDDRSNADFGRAASFDRTLILSPIGLGSLANTLTRVARWPYSLRWRGSSRRSCSLGISASFANYNATYGSLGAAVGVMISLWISNAVMLLGAELNAEIEHQTARDSTIGEEKL
jgi:hypothetical protein